MKHSRVLRCLIGLWSIWLNAALIEAPGAHACPLHSGMPAPTHARAMHDQAAHDQAMRAHASHEMRDMHGAAHLAPMEMPDDQGCVCTCISSCCGVTPTRVAEAPPKFVAQYVASAPQRVGYAVAITPVARRYTQPFAIGPPSRA